MKVNLSPLKKILENFIQQAQQKEKLAKSVKNLVDPEYIDELDYWTREECYIWMNAEPYYNLMQKNNEKLQIPKCFYEPASKFYDEWMDQDLDIQDYEKYIIQPPLNTHTLLEYLHHLDKLVSEKKVKTERWKLSLKSFASYIRRNYLKDEPGFLNIIFPPKLELSYGRVTRNLPPEEYPIDILDTLRILKSLVQIVLRGRPNKQHTTAEVIALFWCCLLSARERTLTEISLLLTLTSDNLKKEITPNEKIFYKSASYYSDSETYYLHLPTLFWEEKIRISKTLFHYLSALSKINGGKIFSHSIKPLRVRFKGEISKIQLSANPEEIFFRTFLTEPHENIGHRFRPKQKQ